MARRGPGPEVRYTIQHDGQTLEVPLVTVPQDKPSSIENYLRVTGLVYLFIGFFIFARRWTAPRAVHFYIFCLVSFVLYSFHYSGKLNSFDWTIYWGNVVAWMLQPALLVHFALVFPERRGTLWPKLLALYSIPAALLTLHISVATWNAGFDALHRQPRKARPDGNRLSGMLLPDRRRNFPGQLFPRSQWHLAPATQMGHRRNLRWYHSVFPVLHTAAVWPARRTPWMKMSAFSLALIPLCFGYAIIRYRLMDVDIIFKRGLAYTFATGAVVAIYFGAIAVIGELSHTAWPTGPGGAVAAIVVAAFLFQPLRDWVQARLDHFFYRDRLDYRRTLIEFGRALTNEVRLEPLLGSVLDRISQTLLVDRLAVFLEDPARIPDNSCCRARWEAAPKVRST